MKVFILSEWLQQHFDPSENTPAYQQLYNLISKAILNEYMVAGTKLPSTRELSSDLKIARNTILQVYEQLMEEGFVSAGVGRGTFVQDISYDLVQTPSINSTIYDSVEHIPDNQVLSNRGLKLKSSRGFSHKQSGAFIPGIPDVREFPIKAWSRIQNRIWRSEPWDLLSYAPAGGYAPLRKTISEYLGSVRSVNSKPNQVVVTTGIHQGIDIAARLLCDPGDIVWIEEPAYWGIRNTVASLGLKVVPIKVDKEGINPSLEDQKQVPKLIIVTPSHQYPLGMVMSLSRRCMLLEYAHRNSCWILEDDYDSEFRYGTKPLPSLQGMDKQGRVLYAGSFSKTLRPGLRIGFIIVPEALADTFANTVTDLYREGNMVEQAILSEFIRQGYLNSHIKRMRRKYSDRRSFLLQQIHNNFGNKLEALGGDAGLHLVLILPDHVHDKEIYQKVQKQGVITRPLSHYYSHEKNKKSGLVLGYAGTNNEEIKQGFDILVSVIKDYI